MNDNEFIWINDIAIERGLDYSATKGKAISQNIANIDTPNYKAKNVSFKEVFARCSKQIR